MTNGLHRLSSLIATGGLAAAVALTAVLRTGGAQEAIPCPPECVKQTAVFDHRIVGPAPLDVDHLHRVVVNDQGRVSVFITKLPALGQFVKESCGTATCCEEMFERLAAGLNVPAGKEACDEHLTRFIVVGCPVAAAAECACGSDCVCGSDNKVAACTASQCAAGQCAANQCPVCVAKGKEAACGDEHCAAAVAAHHRESLHNILTDHHPLKLLSHIAGLVGEKAAAQAALETQREAHEEFSELYETMAELIAANAALQARLEAQTEQAKLAEKLADLAAENARLKTHVELAAERAEVTRSALSLSLENERLKGRLAELEHQQALAEAARTALRSRGERKAR